MTIGEVGIQAQQIWAVVELHMLHVDQTVNGVAQFSLEPRLGAAVVQNAGCNKNDVRSTPLYFEYPPLVCCIPGKIVFQHVSTGDSPIRLGHNFEESRT